MFFVVIVSFIDSVKPELKERSKIKVINNSVLEIDNFI